MNPVEQEQVGELRMVARVVWGLAPEVALVAPGTTVAAPAAQSAGLGTSGGAAAATPSAPTGGGGQAGGAAPKAGQSEVALMTQAVKDAVRSLAKRVGAAERPRLALRQSRPTALPRSRRRKAAPPRT